MVRIRSGARIGVAAVALGLSLAGPQTGIAAADGDEAAGGAASASAGPDSSGRQPNSGRPARTPGSGRQAAAGDDSTAAVIGGSTGRGGLRSAGLQAEPEPEIGTEAALEDGSDPAQRPVPAAATAAPQSRPAPADPDASRVPRADDGIDRITGVDRSAGVAESGTPAPAAITAAPSTAAPTAPAANGTPAANPAPCAVCRALAAAATDRLTAPPVLQAARSVASTAGPLSALPAGPVADLVSGALMLLRRNGFGASLSPAASTGGTSLAAVPTGTAAETPLSGIANLLDDARIWVDTFANFYPWRSGSLLPEPLRKLVFNSTPVASAMQVELDLAQGVASQPIPFSAQDSDGNRLRYSVPDKGTAGAPEHGTVVVDNATGTFTYTPDADFTGTDTFSFVASDDTSPHLHAWDNLLNAAFGLLNTSLAGGHRVTETVTVFNNVNIRPDPAVPLYTDITDEFSVLTYDVSGMLFGLSGGAFPRFLNIAQIGSRLNAFDIVNVQDDVAYHPFLIARTELPDRTPPSVATWSWPVGVPFSDGLNSLSAYYIESLDRQAWTTRPNLLNPGGFTYSREHIPGGSSIDVYNVDASGGSLTNAEIAQLSEFIQQNSVGRAVIVTGDFGQLYSDPGQTLSQFAAANSLTDAWVEIEYGGVAPTGASKCAYEDSCEQPDKIFYRDAAPLDPADPASSPVRLQALSYTNEGMNFLNGSGVDLSAHRPQSVTFGYTVDAIGPMTVDTANWMADLPALADLPLTRLPIPGTHDSGSYGITPESDWALTGKDDFGVLTELPGFLQNLLVKPIAAAWGKTQSGSLYDQFSDGIRYVDLRLTNEPDGTIYLEHGLRGPQASTVLADIAAFADTHPKEVLVVYVQGIKNFTPETHAEFVADMNAAFGSRMVPRAVGTSATLADLWAIDKNVIVVYNNADVVAADPNLWPDDTLWRKWPNYQSVERLLGANEDNLANRPPAAIWGLLGEPTPNTTSIVTGVLTIGPRSNREFMWNVHQPVQQWMRVNFKDSLNLATTDWYQEFWPAGSSFVRDGIGAVYETLGARVSGSTLL